VSYVWYSFDMICCVLPCSRRHYQRAIACWWLKMRLWLVLTMTR